ncbi:hypothetical protein JZ751_005687 [Albula glossodonta]|uniref:Ubiquitin-like protease family profile domain-containing protein n=1 Tax=Albula glossodonta TaxID=121402 RepID=A0A8T2N554_9TELE|nr:hypothetical protein JZ751_005687 [Albula glossodonta]
MPGTAEVEVLLDGSAVHTKVRKGQNVSSPGDKVSNSKMSSTFRIPKRKTPEDRCTQMESPLSKLQDSQVQKMQWTPLSDSGRKPQGCRHMNGNSSSNHNQVARSSNSIGRSRPKRASDSLCQDRPLPKRTSDPSSQDQRRQTGSGSGQPWRSSEGLRSPLQSSRSRTADADPEQALEKDTARPPRAEGERTPSEAQKHRRPSSGTENSETENKKKEGRRDSLGRSNGVENGDGERRGVGPSRGSVLCHSGESVGGEVTPKRPPVEESPRRGVGVTPKRPLVEDSQMPLKSGEKEKKTPQKLPNSSIRPKKLKLSTAEPIVLSSDDDDGEEEEGDPPPGSPQVMVLPPSSRVETLNQGHPGDENDTQVFDEEMMTGLDLPVSPAIVKLPFFTLHVGTLRAEASGSIMITNDCITIPLKDCTGEVEVSLSLVSSELRRYGVWDGSVLCDGEATDSDSSPAPSLLFLWVSDAQAQLVQTELSIIHPVQGTGPASPFLLLSLRDSLEGLQGVLLASFMEVLALHRGAQDLMHPFSWSQGVAMIRGSGRDPHLLSLLGLESEPVPSPEEQAEPCPAPTEQDSPARPKPSYTLCHCRIRSSYAVSIATRPSSKLILFPPPPSKGGITVTTEDLECLDSGEFLNDVIIDFYLKYLMLEKAPKAVAERSHIFSSFFYKQLTRKDNASEEASGFSAQHRRHQRVRTWTRHVDIFNKDYLFVPVNQEAHWYLVVICFPGLFEPKYEKWSRSGLGDPGTQGEQGNEPDGITRTPDTKQRNSQEQLARGVDRDQRRAAHSVLVNFKSLSAAGEQCAQSLPCILIMDSLKLSSHERILKLLREYLQVEWEVRRNTPRDFTAEQMKGSYCRVPLQDNSSDCGVYLLQYVESFLQNPVVHFDLPLRLEHWFPRQQIRRKRDEIRDLVLQLHRKQQGCGGS